jgi:tetratricopeptide (TPR) repeat protein/serine/threonine protein kinase
MPEPQPTSRLLFLQAGLEPIAGYQLIVRLGGGSFGEVWKAAAPGGFPVALKFIRLGSAESDPSAASTTELRALHLIKNIHHPNLLAVFGTWETEDYLIVAMELADGTLRDRFQKGIKAGQKGIPREEVLDLFEEAAKAIDYLNTYKHIVDGKAVIGVQHRDIKPDNILLVGGGVKVADYGMARLLESSLGANSGGLTIAYAAPEFFNRRTSEHSDQYSLAVTYCEMRGGRLPFGGSLEDVIRGHMTGRPDLTMLPPEEIPILERALAKEPSQRWPNCRALIQALRTAASSRQTVDPAAAVTIPFAGPALSPVAPTPPSPRSPPSTSLPPAAPSPEGIQTVAPVPHLPPGTRPESSSWKTNRISSPTRPARYGLAALLSLIALLTVAGSLWLAGVLPMASPTDMWARWFPISGAEPAPGLSSTSEATIPGPEGSKGEPEKSANRPLETIVESSRKTFRLSIADQIALRAGDKLRFEVRIQRDSVVGAVELRFAPSEGITIPPVTIPADKSVVEVQAEASRTVAPGPRKIRATATAGDIKTETDVLLILHKMPSLSLESVREWAIPAGETRNLSFRVVRDGHAEAVEVRLVDLPRHVIAPAVVIPAAGPVTASEAAIEVTATDDAKEGTQLVSLTPSLGSAVVLKLTVQPSLAAQAVNRGETLRQQKHYEQALREYGAAIERNPKLAAAYRGRGQVYSETGQHDKAVAEFSEAIMLDPNDASSYAQRAAAYDARNESDKAIADYNEAIRLDPKNAVTFKNRGLMYRKKREYDKAIADYDQAIKLDGKFAVAYASRAHAYHLKGDLPRAIVDYTEAINLDPNYALAYSNRAYAYHLQSEYDKAIADTTEAIRLNPNYDVAFANRGFTYFKKKDYKQALKDLDKAIELDPKVALYYDWRSRVYDALGDKLKAESDRKKSASLKKGAG